MVYNINNNNTTHPPAKITTSVLVCMPRSTPVDREFEPLSSLCRVEPITIKLISVDREFEPLSSLCRVFDYKTDICSFSASHTTLRTKRKDWFLAIRITCPSGATHRLLLHRTNTIKIQPRKADIIISSTAACSRHGITKKIPIWR